VRREVGHFDGSLKAKLEQPGPDHHGGDHRDDRAIHDRRGAGVAGGDPQLHTTSDKILTSAPSNMTPPALGTLAIKMRGCSRGLARLGAPSERLAPVYRLAKSGCAQYDKAAKCFATAASIGIPFAGTSQERRLNQAIDCGFAAPGKGSALLAEAEAKGFEIKETAG
jgi:hypothetical protein